jgi:aldehyde:ferredoxin oxidoreductase
VHGRICLFATFAVSLRQFAPWLKAATGLPALGDPENLLTIGERINNLTRLFNLREGLTAAMDDLPGRFKSQGLDTGPNRGRTIDITEMKRRYYLIRGWDGEGRPTDEKLKQLGLEGDCHV